ncbi:MAG: ABC transporter ATP-binding protein [Bacteroidia bacterium]|nr:ABC transporter ATP-binding protein [Rikenellaceae bacterium]NCB18748.1 ABC transporter ATP-binding protein [Bacteroidia bacterium]
MNTFLRLLAFARPFHKFWPRYLIISIFSVIFGIANYALIGPLLKVLFEADTMVLETTLPPFALSADYFKAIFNHYLVGFIKESGPLTGLVYVCVVLIVTSMVSNLMRYLSQRILVSMRTHIMRNIRNALFEKITKLHVGYFNAHRKGDILSSISNDVTEVQNGVANSFHILFRDPLLIIGFLSMLLYMSPQLTIVTLLTLPVSALVIGRITRKLKRGAKDTQSMMGRIVSHFEEAISGIRIIKAFNAQRFVNENFHVSNESHRRISKRMFNKQELASPMSEFLGITVAASVIFYAGYLQTKGQLGMEWSSFVVYIGFYWRVLEPSKAISNAFANLQRGLASGERLFAILDVEPEIKKCANPVPVNDFKESIEFRDVSFKYKNEPVLKNISVTIPKGKTIALVGPSGAGKSTMADLIPRFYDVVTGSILLDGKDIREYEPKGLISLMGIVTQEAILFNDTVFNNIAFGMTGVTMDDVCRAAEIANAHEFISQLPQGYQTNIGDRGANLSGGQRQRLAIARAVLKNPPILILDEATSALDTESEKLVQEALTNLMKNRTSVVIAHRLSTIQHADQIVVLKDGEIVEKGTHQELIHQKGLYSHLCQLQTFS